MRKSLQIAMFLVMLNAIATGMTDSGYAAILGVEPEVGGDQAINQSQQAADPDDISGSGIVGAVDLAAFVISGAFAILDMIKNLTVGAPLMLQNAGLVGWVVNFILAPLYIFVIVDLYGLIKSGD